MADQKSNIAMDIARKALAAFDAGKPVGLAVIATVDDSTAYGFTGYTTEMAQHMTARFNHWQLDLLAKKDLMAAAQVAAIDPAFKVAIDRGNLEVVK